MKSSRLLNRETAAAQEKFLSGGRAETPPQLQSAQPNRKSKIVNFKVEEDFFAEFSSLATLQRKSVSAFIVEALRKHIKDVKEIEGI